MKIFEDRNLSLKAKGIYFMIKSLNDNGEKVTQSILASMTSTGEKSLATGVKELKEKGYLEIENKNVNGIFVYNYKLLR